MCLTDSVGRWRSFARHFARAARPPLQTLGLRVLEWVRCACLRSTRCASAASQLPSPRGPGNAMPDQPAENRPRYARIPSGRHGLAPALVSADQRARLHAAMVQVVAETGYVGTTVEAVLSRAGVSRRTFYDNFKNKQDCFISAFDAVLRDGMRQGALAYQETLASSGIKDDVRARLRAGLLALFGRVLSDPLGAQVILIEVLNCGEPGLRRLEQAVAELERMVDQAFGAAEEPPGLPPEIIKVIVGGVLEIVTSRLRHEKTDELLLLAEPLLAWMLSYRSPDAAAIVAHAGAHPPATAVLTDTPAADPTDQRLERELGSAPLWRDSSARPIALQDQQARIIQATIRIVSDGGLAALSLSKIAPAAGVSHHTIRKYFSSANDAFAAAYRAGSRAMIAYCLEAYTAETDWRSAVHAGLGAQLRFLATNPELARIGFLEIYAAGSELLELRETELQLVTAALEPGYRETIATPPPHEVVSEAIRGGIYRVTQEFLLHNPPEELPTLLPEETYAALAPFVGAEAAASVAARS